MAKLRTVLSPAGKGAWADVEYSISYDSIKNTTTVTFDKISCRTWAASYTTATASITLTVTATDSGNSASASAYTTDHRTTSNDGCGMTYPKADPASVTVKHSNTAGAKGVTISFSSLTTWNDGHNSSTDTNSVDVSSASPETGFKVYKLSINDGEGSIIIVNRIDSVAQGELGNLVDGADIYLDDKLKITFDAKPAYALKTYSVNDAVFTNGDTHTVVGDVVVAATAELQGLFYISNGETWDMYQVYIDNGASWDQYIPYIDNGTSWDMYS